jgi:hypothetical protein
LKLLVDQYVKSKKDKAMQAINVEVSQIVDHSNRSLHMSQLNTSSSSHHTAVVTQSTSSKSNINLQESLKKIMDDAKLQEDTFWNSIMNAKAHDVNNRTFDKKKVETIKTLYRKNMQVAAQICVLRQLQQQQASR